MGIFLLRTRERSLRSVLLGQPREERAATPPQLPHAPTHAQTESWPGRAEWQASAAAPTSERVLRFVSRSSVGREEDKVLPCWAASWTHGPSYGPAGKSFPFL